MLWGAHIGSLELRTEGGETRLRAIFPYGQETVLAKRVGMGRERREMIAARAFADRAYFRAAESSRLSLSAQDLTL